MDNINSKQKKLVLLVIIIILAILIYKIYIQSTSRNNAIATSKKQAQQAQQAQQAEQAQQAYQVKEAFTNTNTSGMATDLLTKLKSYDAQATNATNPADLELSIYPWTTKLYNLQTTNQVKAIGLYKPHLSINGIQYTKLGDMISQSADYSPPDNKETTLLIAKVGSDIKAPTDYNQIVSMGNANLPRYYYQFNNLITPNLAISTISNNILQCKNALDNLNGILQNKKQTILDGIKNIISNDANVQIGNTNPIVLARLAAIPRAGNKILTAAITRTTNITIPAGVEFSILGNDGGTQKELFKFNFGGGMDFSQYQTKSKVQQILNASGALQNLTEDNIILKPYNINIFSYINPQDIINYLNDLCTNINTILNLPGLSQDFMNYLNLVDSLDGLSTVMAALSTLSPQQQNPTQQTTPGASNPFAANNILSSYAAVNSNTLLGSVLNVIINFQETIYYPSIRFTPDNLIQTNLASQLPGTAPGLAQGADDTTRFNALIISSSNLIQINNVSISLLDSISINLSNITNNATISTVAISTTTISNTTTKLGNLNQFITIINTNQLEYFPLKIYEPVAPAGYRALGHVFCNVARDLSKIQTMKNVACVPEGCVKEVRDWVPADKVFEYNRDGIYWALYKNPYVGTFIAVSKPGVPDGRVCKVVACVAKCTAVDELKKADQCARTYQAINKTISSEITSTPDLVASTEEDIYLQQIKSQNDNIIALQNRARQLQTDIDKADVITAEMNKAALQNYVDTQKRNIELVADRLERDQNKIQANVNIPPRVLNQIINIINNLPNLSTTQKSNLTNKIISNAQAANSGLLTSAQYNANLNNILKSCPQYDLSGMVKKSVVGDVCYGCGTPE
jgi:type II secretory pathway component PulM